jgi:iron-sulfur cluster assembly accessory protein
MAQQTIELSENAVKKIQSLIAQQHKDGHGLRVKVVGGGCSGLSYKMDLDIPRDGDRIFERDEAKVIVDRKFLLSVALNSIMSTRWIQAKTAKPNQALVRVRKFVFSLDSYAFFMNTVQEVRCWR